MGLCATTPSLTFVGERPFGPLLGFAYQGDPMQDMKAHLEKLRTDAAECALIRDLATDPEKRALFTRLAAHLGTLASEVEAAIAAKLTGGEGI
jgi:hypothetical protein